MKTKGIVLSLILSITLLNSCYKDVEEELYPCGIENLTYTTDIEPIINANCNACHYGPGSSSGVQLDTYEKLRDVVLRPSAKFFCRIKFEDDCAGQHMPQSGSKLNDCSILKIEQWAVQNFPN